MATKKKLLQAAAGSAGGGGEGPLYVEDVFATQLYDGNAQEQSITNGINLGQVNDGYSAYFDGSGDYIRVNSLTIGTGDFTVECWGQFTNTGSNRTLFTVDETGIQVYYRNASSDWAVYDSAGATSSGVSVTNRTWYHVALVRSGSTVTLYVDGTSVLSKSNSSDLTGNITVGAYGTTTDPMRGYITNLRVSDNARYTSNFTAPTSALEVDADTISLTLNTHELEDAASSSRAVVANGNAFMQGSSPFSADDAGKGGMVWLKCRTFATSNYLFDTERGAGNYIKSNLVDAEAYSGVYLNSFNASGFSVSSSGEVNEGGRRYVSWSFRKARNFFDVVKYTGDGVNPKTISHNLGAVPGMITVKALDNNTNNGAWKTYHRKLNGGTNPTDKVIQLNNGDEETTSGAVSAFTSTPTSTTFSVSTDLNQSGQEYIAYIWAHHDGNGTFGENEDQDIIVCDNYTEINGSDVFVDLGFEPQWVILKARESSGGWGIYDTVRGWTSDADSFSLAVNNENTEQTQSDRFKIHPNGFTWKNTGAARDIIFIAIRRPMKPVSLIDNKVFDVEYTNFGDAPAYRSSFTSDAALTFYRPGYDDGTNAYPEMFSRLTGQYGLQTPNTRIQNNRGADATWDYHNGFYDAGFNTTSYGAWQWQRRAGYFDVVTYVGNGTAGHSIPHALGVAPEMMWVKKRTGGTGAWPVYHVGAHSTSPENYFLQLNSTITATLNSARWNNTAPTTTEFTVGNGGTVNDSGHTYIAYLFASLDGVSKLGTFSHTFQGGNTDVDCGFSNGARFVLTKRYNSSGNWEVYDTLRGITSGNDPFIRLDTTDAEQTGNNGIDPISTGFRLNSSGWNTGDYIFYAIA